MGISTRITAAALLLASCGCVLPGKFLTADIAPSNAPASVVAAWSPKVTYTPDPANGGVPAPGIAGRVYLFGATPDFPMACDGAMTVEVFDDTPVQGQPSSVKLEVWQFDELTMKKLQKRDAVGMGYTIFLPWGSYRPDIKQVHLSLRFEPKNGNPVFAPTSTMTLEHSPPVGSGSVASR